MDTPTQQRITLLHPKLRDEVTTLIQQADIALITHSHVRIVQSLRTFEEQDALYALGRTVKNPDGITAKKPLGNIVTKAKGGQSDHNYGLAFDFCLIIDNKEVSWDLKKDWDGDKVADWMEVVKIFRNNGYDWGGTWKFVDNPHIEKLFGHTWKDLLVKYNSGQTFIDTNGKKYVSL